MKVVNIMNFVRQCEPRDKRTDALLFDTTEAQLELVESERLPNTFLLQYDALCDQKYVDLFKGSNPSLTELGLWYEIVEPLTAACGMEYRSENGWKWDWHIIPGFSMAYTKPEREKLIDEAMRKFREVFGHYPKTVGSWLIDTHTARLLADKYQVKALCICRDQTNTDAYTLVGGYFNGAYYPSRKNIFTPAESPDNSLGVPVFRLLGPCPIFNYDGPKFMSKEGAGHGGCYTLEPAWYTGREEKCVDNIMKALLVNESLNYGYAQLGQENSFGYEDLITPLKMQIGKLRSLPGLKIEKMCESGENFIKTFSETPASVCASLESWEGSDLQSVYYQCKNYVANVFRDGGRVFIRAFYLFDGSVPELYEDAPCASFSALYENLPIVDTVIWSKGKKEDIGMTLDNNGCAFGIKKLSDSSLEVFWKDKKVIFTEEGISTEGIETITYDPVCPEAEITVSGNRLKYIYKGNGYYLSTGAEIEKNGNVITFKGKRITLIPERN